MHKKAKGKAFGKSQEEGGGAVIDIRNFLSNFADIRFSVDLTILQSKATTREFLFRATKLFLILRRLLQLSQDMQKYRWEKFSAERSQTIQKSTAKV